MSNLLPSSGIDLVGDVCPDHLRLGADVIDKTLLPCSLKELCTLLAYIYTCMCVCVCVCVRVCVHVCVCVCVCVHNMHQHVHTVCIYL